MCRRPEWVGVMGGRSGLCGHGWCVWWEEGGKKEGGREREGSVIQVLSCLSHMLRI